MNAGREEKFINFQVHKLGIKSKPKAGFTLIELLVVMSIISLLMGILLPVLGKVRRQARMLLGANNQREVVSGVNIFASDNRDSYPSSVASAGRSKAWNWSNPRKLIALYQTTIGPHRAMSEYLRGYVEDAAILYCPNAPRKYKYLQEAWDAGDDWNNPDSWLKQDALEGTYCFYWNYTGLVNDRLFRGPRTLANGPGQGKLLLSCYFGYDFYRSPQAYGSCQKFKGANITPESLSSSAYWSRPKSDSVNLNTINVKLQAGYTDGHVETYTLSEAVKMKVIKNRKTNEPYDYGPGDFYLPANGLH